jgi:hypothetical protein
MILTKKTIRVKRMKKHFFYKFFFNIAIATIFAILTLNNCKSSPNIIFDDLVINTGPDETIYNLKMITVTGDKTEWQLEASYAKKFSEKKNWIAYEVEMETLNEEDKNFYSSDSVYVFEIENEFIGYGNVVIKTPNALLKTDKVIWYRNRDRIFAPNDVYFVRDNNEMWGKNVVTNSNLDFLDARNINGQGSSNDKSFLK